MNVRDMEDADLLPQIASPAIQRLFLPGENPSVELAEVSFDPLSRYAIITVSNEVLRVMVTYPGDERTMEQAREDFANSLQDAIAESEFGWGQLRE